MKIKAVLIGCAGEGDDYLPGVSKDIQGMYDYLLSDRGGQWKSNEIVKLETKFKSRIENLINEIRSEENDFVLFYFAGHGSYSHLLGRKFYVDDEDFFTQQDIGAFSEKQICIFDTCANFERSITEKFEFGVESRTYDSMGYHRNKYLAWINQCPSQKVSLYACSEDESSGESEQGGDFTQALISSAIHSNEDLSILEAFELAKPKVVRSSQNEQNPAYNIRPRSGKKLPFSVA